MRTMALLVLSLISTTVWSSSVAEAQTSCAIYSYVKQMASGIESIEAITPTTDESYRTYRAAERRYLPIAARFSTLSQSAIRNSCTQQEIMIAFQAIAVFTARSYLAMLPGARFVSQYHQECAAASLRYQQGLTARAWDNLQEAELTLANASRSPGLDDIIRGVQSIAGRLNVESPTLSSKQDVAGYEKRYDDAYNAAESAHCDALLFPTS